MDTTNATTRTVTEAALVKQIRRAMARDGETLLRNRPAWKRRSVSAEPDYYYVDLNRNMIAGWTDDLEDLARQLGVLREGETLAPDGGAA